jgi:hypothetical protein
MMMPVFGIVVAVRVRMTRAIGMDVLVLVKDDLEPAAESVGDPAQGLEAGHMLATLEPRDHRLGHAQALAELFLRFAGFAAQFEKVGGATGRDGIAAVGPALPRR